ncbi:DUF3693 domain-containing protein [Gallaecimonas mangrovi]|uniref:DUF3693 domain-containing protein n=1 Tax=Gallaecimonas mangrovi TaxID=2291597 RepID=UPI000E203219|nr:DUF3693 domain-containing protein [Gallaecimonas mangrovi]
MYIKNLVETALKAAGCSSQNELAKDVLGISSAFLSELKTGKAPAADHLIIKLAEIAGVEPSLAVVSYHEERAKTDKERSVWSTLVKRISHGAAASVAAMMLTFLPQKPVQADPMPIAHNVYYVKLPILPDRHATVSIRHWVSHNFKL